jgi:hypothetical protein
MKSTRSMAILLAAAALASSLAQAAPVAAASPSPGASPAQSGTSTGSPTPEDAVTAYVAGIAAADFDKVLATTAVEEMASKYDFVAQAVRFEAFTFADMLAPSNYDFYAQMNVAFLQSTIARQAMFLAYSLTSSEDLSNVTISPVDQQRAQTFVSEVNPVWLKDLSVVEIRFPSAKLENDPRVMSNFAAQAGIYGADEVTERAALLSLDGRDYEIGFTLIRYGASWYVASQISPLLGLPGDGTAQPTTQSDFEAQTAGN